MITINRIPIKDKEVAIYFGITPTTMSNYNKSNDLRINRRYNAYRSLYMDFIRSLDAAQVAEASQNKEYFDKLIRNNNIFDNLRIV